MRQKATNAGNAANRVLSQLAAEKKKVVMAICLIGVMAFMWVKVLTQKGPEGAQAANSNETAKSQQVSGGDERSSELKVSFIELPNVKGRNDALTKDFFAGDGWQEFVRDGDGMSRGAKEVSFVSGNGSEELMKRIAENVKLEAIMSGESPQVFMNDKLLSVGGKLVVDDGVETYECEVTKIERNAVFMRCRESEIKLQLMQAVDENDY